jgi:hypothetical protein
MPTPPEMDAAVNRVNELLDKAYQEGYKAGHTAGASAKTKQLTKENGELRTKLFEIQQAVIRVAYDHTDLQEYPHG